MVVKNIRARYRDSYYTHAQTLKVDIIETHNLDTIRI